MKIYSEITNQEYKTVQECLAAEEKFEQERATKNEQRKNDAKEVEKAYTEAAEATDKYLRLRNAFVDQYGSFHMTIKNNSKEFDSFDQLFRFIFK